MLSKRRLPASVSKRPMSLFRAIPPGIAALILGLGGTPLVMAGDRLDRGDDFVVADFLAGSEEGCVAAIHEDGEVVLGVAAQGVDQLLALFGVDGSEIHGIVSFRYDLTIQS